MLLDTNVDSSADRMYGLATYLLVNNGKDLLGNGAATRPDGYWKGYDVQLGDALGKRYLQDGVWRRDFERGTVLVNEPGEPRRSVNFAPSLRDIAGEKHASVTLGPAAGAVLLRDGLDPTPAAGSPPAAAPPAPSVVREPVPTAAGTRPGSVPQPARVTLRVRARRAARGFVLVSGTVRGARSGRVLVTARSASRRARATLRLRNGEIRQAAAHERRAMAAAR